MVTINGTVFITVSVTVRTEMGELRRRFSPLVPAPPGKRRAGNNLSVGSPPMPARGAIVALAEGRHTGKPRPALVMQSTACVDTGSLVACRPRQASNCRLMASRDPFTTSTNAGVRVTLVLFGSTLVQFTTKQNVTGVAFTTICPAYDCT
jgi:hypothetical protein